MSHDFIGTQNAQQNSETDRTEYIYAKAVCEKKCFK